MKHGSRLWACLASVLLPLLIVCSVSAATDMVSDARHILLGESELVRAALPLLQQQPHSAGPRTTWHIEPSDSEQTVYVWHRGPRRHVWIDCRRQDLAAAVKEAFALLNKAEGTRKARTVQLRE